MTFDSGSQVTEAQDLIQGFNEGKQLGWMEHLVHIFLDAPSEITLDSYVQGNCAGSTYLNSLYPENGIMSGNKDWTNIKTSENVFIWGERVCCTAEGVLGLETTSQPQKLWQGNVCPMYLSQESLPFPGYISWFLILKFLKKLNRIAFNKLVSGVPQTMLYPP